MHKSENEISSSPLARRLLPVLSRPVDRVVRAAEKVGEGVAASFISGEAMAVVEYAKCKESGRTDCKYPSRSPFGF